MVFHRLYDDDGIVHHQPNRKDKPKKRQSIDRESEYRKDDKGSYQRNWNGKQRNQRCPPSLKEDVDDDDDQDQSFYECLVNFVDAGTDSKRRIQSHNVVEALWEAPF